MCKMSCLLKSLVAKYPETDISDDAASTDLKTQSSIAKNLAFRYHPMLARLVSILYYVMSYVILITSLERCLKNYQICHFFAGVQRERNEIGLQIFAPLHRRLRQL